MKRGALLAVVCLAFGGCGSGSRSNDGGGGAAGSVGLGGARGNAGAGAAGGADPACASAVASQPCTTPGASCGGEGCTDLCQFCNVLQCMNGVWQPMESSPAPCWACGSILCAIGSQYCEVAFVGSASDVMWSCVPTPAACRTTPTCACLVSQGVSTSSNCGEEGTGQLLVAK